jgi:O-methyltransferase domain/Dimerisation domain
METNLPPKIILTQMILGYVTSKAIHVATKLNIADLIAAQGPMNCSGLAKKTGAHEESLHRLLRALASVEIFQEDSEGKFSLTPMAECLKEDSPDSLKAMSLSTGAAFYKAYEEFLYSIQTGDGGLKKALGMPIFDYLTNNPEEGKIFDRMMTDFHGDETAPMVGTYNFSDFKTIVDVGGGNGSVISAVIKNNPGVSGVLFDLPDVINRSRENIAAWGLSDRIKLDTGSFFESVSGGGDAYILRHIIHDWSDSDAVTILSNCRKAMNPGGKVLVVEAVIPKGNDPNPFKWLDLTMLMIGGKERTEEQFKDIFTKAGLKLARIVPFTPVMNVVEGVAG